MVFISAGALVSVYLLYLQVKASADEILLIGWWGQRPPLSGCFEIDMLSVFMTGSISVLGLLVAVYSTSYMEKESRLTEFYTLMTFMMAGMMGVVMAGDMFTLFVFWELMGLSSYVLVAFQKRTWGPIEAGFKYLVMSATAGAFLLLSMSIMYGMTGTLNLAQISSAIRGQSVSPWLSLLFVMLIVGFGVKSAIVPFHTWLPDAHSEAPSSISALLSGIVVKIGIYGILRIIALIYGQNVANWQIILAGLAVITMFVGNVMALLQTDLKRLLAFSTVAQIGYILFGVSIFTATSITGSLFHVVNHLIMKGLLFLGLGCFIHQAGTRDIHELAGVRKLMPLTSACFTVGVFAIAAVPGLNGFWSELMIVTAGVQSGMMLLSGLMVLNIFISVAYYLRIIYNMILKEPGENLVKVKESPNGMLIPIIVLALACIAIGVYPDPVIRLAASAAEALLNVDAYINAVM